MKLTPESTKHVRKLMAELRKAPKAIGPPGRDDYARGFRAGMKAAVTVLELACDGHEIETIVGGDA